MYFLLDEIVNKNNSSVVKNAAITNRNQLLPRIGFMFILLIILQFYLAPLLASAAALNSNKYTDYLYLYTIPAYTLIVLGIIIFHRTGIEVFKDQFSLWLVVVGCVLAASLGQEKDTIYKVFLILLGLRLSIHIVTNRKTLKIHNLESVVIGLLWSVGTILIIALLLHFLDPERQSRPPNLSSYFISTFLFQIAFVTVIEEACFRGLVFYLLMMNGYQEDRALMIQGILFWGGHYLRIVSNPALFFIAIPVLAVSTSLITKKYKMLYLPIVVHTLANVFGPFLFAIL
jgi:hypothetical protein